MPEELKDRQGRRLNLKEPAEAAARELLRLFPDVVFTSGRRDLMGQCRAMAENVAQAGHAWLSRTYKWSPALQALADWLKARPKLKDAAAIGAGFFAILSGMQEAEVNKLSLHLSGLAFDVKPMHGDHGAQVKKAIRHLPHLEKFLEREGGLERWHLQFKKRED